MSNLREVIEAVEKLGYGVEQLSPKLIKLSLLLDGHANGEFADFEITISKTQFDLSASLIEFLLRDIEADYMARAYPQRS